MKKLLLATAGLALLAAPAFAEMNVDVSIGVPAPEFVAPVPVILGQPPIIVNDPHHRHRHDDLLYWREQREREAWEHAHPGGRWDHDRWAHEHR